MKLLKYAWISKAFFRTLKNFNLEFVVVPVNKKLFPWKEVYDSLRNRNTAVGN